MKKSLLRFRYQLLGAVAEAAVLAHGQPHRVSVGCGGSGCGEKPDKIQMIRRRLWRCPVWHLLYQFRL